MTEFKLQERLAADATPIADWTLSRVLLMNDARFPWLILVPRRADVTEIFQLNPSDRATLTEEIARASEHLISITGITKINVGALGNLVPQLHVHVVARNPADAAWPGPVWGHGKAVPYDTQSRDALVGKIVNAR